MIFGLRGNTSICNVYPSFHWRSSDDGAHKMAIYRATG